VLVKAGAFVDAVTPTTGHTPLMDALWYKSPDIVEYLLLQNAGLNLFTHYGFSLKEHFEYELNVNIQGKDKMLASEKLLKARMRADDEKISDQQLMAAVTEGNHSRVQALLADGVEVNDRYPRVNGFNDGHTPLHVAARDGHTEIVQTLLTAGADVNASEPVFGAVPLHKAVYNGHADITRILAESPDIDLNYQGATNGYTPLHDALWHGYADCARILLEAEARLDVAGRDGKTPYDIAADTFGAEDPLALAIKQAASARRSTPT
jgi:ankyrin repeat protein